MLEKAEVKGKYPESFMQGPIRDLTYGGNLRKTVIYVI